MTNQIQQIAENIVRNEVHCCMSYIVATLAKQYGNRFDDFDMAEIVEQAFETMTHVKGELEDGEEYDREVFEVWSVSGWLANKLEERGERIVRDFGNHNLWGRTTTGQSISMDHVIEQIAEDVKFLRG